MDCVSPALDIASRLWDCTSKRAVYIRELPENLNSLRNYMEQLNNVLADVLERVEREEKLEKKRTHAVDGWIKSVEAMEKQVNDLLVKGEEEIEKKCLGTCCPKNCRGSYKIGKMVRAKLEDVAAKKTEGLRFCVVAEPVSSPAVIERPLDETVGIDSFFNHVCMQLLDEKVRRLGLYGMGGVGKTTLLNRINNEFLKTRVDLDTVIWVTVSRPATVEKVQRVLFNKLNIPDHKWEGRSEDERKEEIFNVLKTKKFVLLLDDVWEPLDLLEVGIPPLRDGNNSKVVLTTRFSTLCRDMGAKAIEVKCLAWEDAFALFQKYVGEDTIHSHPQIPKLAEIAAKECDGLPLALIVIGRAMAGARTPEEWEKKIQMLKHYPAKFPGMEKHLFSRLAFSYDSLPDEATKSCFLYCSLFPEDYGINCVELIRLWIGEGFLDEYSGIRKARNGGEEIIASLKHACLLEDFTLYPYSRPYYWGETYVKMHDVIRDMALWLACEGGIKEQNKFVVVDKGDLVNAQLLEKWKGAQKISSFSANFEEQMESSPPFGNIQTLMLCGPARRMMIPLLFPSGFFGYMPKIKVLDFTNLWNLEYLPLEINKLVTLQYLNLTGTGVREIPEGLKNLRRLRCLILDRMECLGNFPSGILPCLSSLQLFSLTSDGTPGDCQTLMEELEGLACIEEISVALSSVISLQTLLNSHKLRGCMKLLQVDKCDDDMNILHLLFPHPETLEIRGCSMLEEVVIHLEKKGVYPTFPRHQSMFLLSDLHIRECGNLKKLTCLAYAPNLKVLWIFECESLEELIQVEDECGTSEIKSDLEMLSRLTRLHLVKLNNLRSICRWNLLFPSLKVMSVFNCPKLRKLPFDSNITRSQHLQEILGKQEWWEQLEWEDEAIKHHLTPYFKLGPSK